jgi:hypothetical protein
MSKTFFLRRLSQVVADVFAQHHEDDVFGDVGGVVADALKVPGDQDQIHELFAMGRLFLDQP